MPRRLPTKICLIISIPLLSTPSFSLSPFSLSLLLSRSHTQSLSLSLSLSLFLLSCLLCPLTAYLLAFSSLFLNVILLYIIRNPEWTSVPMQISGYIIYFLLRFGLQMQLMIIKGCKIVLCVGGILSL